MNVAIDIDTEGRSCYTSYRPDNNFCVEYCGVRSGCKRANERKKELRGKLEKHFVDRDNEEFINEFRKKTKNQSANGENLDNKEGE